MNWKKDKEFCRLLMTNNEDDEICCEFFEMYYRNFDKFHVAKNFKIICDGKLFYNKQESRLAIRQCAYMLAQCQIMFFLNDNYIESLDHLKEQSLMCIEFCFCIMKMTSDFCLCSYRERNTFSLKTDIEPIRIFETVKECDTAADKLVEIFLSGEISDYNEVCSTLKAIYIFIDNTTEKFKYNEKEQ